MGARASPDGSILDPAALKYAGERIASDVKAMENARKMKEEKEAAARARPAWVRPGPGLFGGDCNRQTTITITIHPTQCRGAAGGRPQ